MAERSPMRMMFLAAGLLAGRLPFSSSAWANNPLVAHSPDTQSGDSGAFVARGVTLFREHQYEQARAAFAHAYELDPQAETLLELALAELEARHPVEASEHLRQYLGRSDAPAAKVDVVRTKWLPRAEAQTARLDVFVRAAAEIRVDGAVAEPAPPPTAAATPASEPVASFVIAAGEHEVTAKEGALVQSQHVVARGGEEVEVHFQRVPDAPRSASASPMETSAVDTRDRARSSRAKWITLLGFESAAVVALGVAIGFSVAFERQGSDADGLMQQVRSETGGDSGCLAPTPAPACAQLGRDRQAQRTNAALANGFYAGAGALAVLGAASFFLWPTRNGSAERGVRPVPLLGDRSAGVGAVAAW